MTISSIQKRKFLQNLYQLLYSNGTSGPDKVIQQPSEEEVLREFDRYFSVNRIGSPLSIDLNLLRNSEITDPDIINMMMARSLFNIEVLYDSIYENNEDLMKVITVLNKKLEHLSKKRNELEKKVDDLLFSNSNTDGFYYSFSEKFNNLKNIDLSLTTCFIDTVNKKATLPKLKSSVIDFIAPGVINLNDIKYDIIFNGKSIFTGSNQNNPNLPNADNLFDGLNNTYCEITYDSNIAGVCALVLTIPINTPSIISRIDGKLSTTSAITTIAEISDSSDPNKSQFRRKQSNSDYDSFSFDFLPQSVGAIKLTLIKYEPDSTDMSERFKPYKYKFMLRDLLVSGQYYDSNGILVSSPISIPLGDNNKIIDAVSVEAVNANQEVGDIKFFVAENVANAENISDFNWIPLSSVSSALSSSEQVVSFNKSQKDFRRMHLSDDPDYTESSIEIFSESSENNLSIKNPSNSIYNGINVYRLGILDSQDSPYNSYILDSINKLKFNYISYVSNLYKNIDLWSSIINGTNLSYNVISVPNRSITNSPSISTNLNLTGISGIMQGSILVEKETKVSTTINKAENAVDWYMAVYLNGNQIADLQSGEFTKEIVWNFNPGINNVTVTFDAEGSASGSFSLMSGESLVKYGTVFLNYYTYVDPFDFRVNRTASDKVFTIDNYLGNKEILSRSKIGSNSRFVYFKNSTTPVESIRFRADLSRFKNPFGTPVLNEYRIKFKNSN